MFNKSLWRSGLRRAQENRNSFKYISHLKMVFMRQLTIKLPAATVIYWNTCQREEKHHAYAFSVFVSFGHWKFEIFPVAHGKAREKKLYWVSINCIFYSCDVKRENAIWMKIIQEEKMAFHGRKSLLYQKNSSSFSPGHKNVIIVKLKVVSLPFYWFFSFARFRCH